MLLPFEHVVVKMEVLEEVTDGDDLIMLVGTWKVMVVTLEIFMIPNHISVEKLAVLLRDTPPRAT